MEIGVVGLGEGGNNVLDSLCYADRSGRFGRVAASIAVDSCRSSLASLEHVPESRRLLVGGLQVDGQGTDCDPEVGKTILQRSEDRIASAIEPGFFDGIDAALVVTGCGGGMAGGASVLVDLLGRLGTVPVYAVVVLPRESVKTVHVRTAGENLNAITAVADGTIAFNNGSVIDSTPRPGEWVETINTEIARRILELCSVVDAAHSSGVGTVFSDELEALLDTDGVATIGRATGDAETASGGLVSRFIGDEPELEDSEIEKRLGSIADEALSSGLAFSNEIGRLSGVVLLVSGPKEYLTRDGSMAAKGSIENRLGGRIGLGTRIVDGASTIEMVVLCAGITDASKLDVLDRGVESVYANAGAGGGDAEPEPTGPDGADSSSGATETATGTGGDTTEATGGGDGGESVPGDDPAPSGDDSTRDRNSHTNGRPDVPPTDVEGIDRPPALTFDDVIGLADVKDRIREDVLLPALDERFDEYDIGSVSGVLFHGPPGTGKTYLAKATAGELGYNYVDVDPSDITSRYTGGGAENVSDLFERARKAQPTLVFIDEIDSVASTRTSDGGMTNSERGMINELLNELSELNGSDDEVIVIGATNTLDDVDSAIKRTGRFDTTIHIGAPDFETRRGILEAELAGGPPNELGGIDSDELRSKTDGLVSSDMVDIAESSIRKALAASARDETPVVTDEHLLESIEGTVEKQRQDTAAARLMDPSPTSDFGDVAGMDRMKDELERKVISPARNPERYEEYGLNTTNGVLLHGPPGTGKTYLSRAVAGELGFNFISITASDIVSKWIGEGTENVDELFETALGNQPSVVFIDEIDAIASQRGGDSRMHQDQEQIVNELLTGLADVQGEDVVVIAATNMLSSLDDALTRSGRFDETIEVPPPDDEARMEMLRHHLAGRPLDSEGIDWEAIRTASTGDAEGNRYVASDIELIAETAARLAFEDESEITQAHLRRAIGRTAASVSSYE